ncbi:MAG: V-type ATP synthase subunit D [Promethearchaeota archaeon]
MRNLLLTIIKKWCNFISFREVKPTKANLINLQKRLSFARRGKNFLEFKREMLMFQVKKNYSDYVSYRNEFIQLFKNTLKKLNQTYKEMGKNNVIMISKISTIQYNPKIDIKHVRDIGINVSKINYELIQEKELPAYSFENSSHYLDELMVLLKFFFERLIKLAEKEDSMLTFAYHFKKIDRRINGLDNIIIPNLQEDINKIKKILEELERESFVRLKKTKNLINKKLAAKIGNKQ